MRPARYGDVAQEARVTERPGPNPYPRRKWIEYAAPPVAILANPT